MKKWLLLLLFLYGVWYLVADIPKNSTESSSEELFDSGDMASNISLQKGTIVSNSLDGYDVNCTVTNNSDKLVGSCGVQAAFYDETGKLVGTGFGAAYNIPAHESRPVTIKSLDIFNMVSHEVHVQYAYVR